MKITKLVLTAGLVAVMCTSLTACKNKGDGTENPDGEEESDKDPMEELKAIPTDIQAEVDLVLKPITDLEKLMADIETAPDRLAITTADLKGMVSASFEGGKIEIDTELDITADARAEIQAMLELALDVAAGIKNTPDTVAAATKNIVAHGARATTLATKLTTKLTAKVKFAKGEEKASLEAQLQEITQLEADISTTIDEAKATVTELPAKIAEMGAKFTASLAVG